MQSQQGPAYNTHGINLASSPWSMCTFISQQLVGFAHFLTCMIRRVEGAKFTVGENSCRSEVIKEGYTSCRYSLESILKQGLQQNTKFTVGKDSCRSELLQRKATLLVDTLWSPY